MLVYGIEGERGEEEREIGGTKIERRKERRGDTERRGDMD